MGKKEFIIAEKIKAVKLHVREGMGYGRISDKYGVPITTLRHWIRKYQTFGAEGLMRRKGNQSYSAELKKCAVEEYLSGKGSLYDICVKYKIYSDLQLRNWIKVYNSHKELRANIGRGSDIYMTKGRNTIYEERVEIVSYCIERGYDYTAAIKKYGVSYQQIYAWVRKYKEKGAEGLVDKRKPKSEMTELEKLRAENRMLEARNKRLETENAVLKNSRKSKGGGAERCQARPSVSLCSGNA